MLKDDELIGVIALVPPGSPRRSPTSRSTLVTNFAVQPVIAIENARSLERTAVTTADLTESLEQQTATSEVLQLYL